MKRYATLIFFAALLFTFLPWLGDTLFNTKGEPREAIVALSMVNSGDYLLPSSFGGDIPYKPPFLAWLIVACSWITGGVNEISARMPSALATIAMAAGFYLFVYRRLRDRSCAEEIAILSTAVTVTAFEVFRAATACRVDMVLTACVVGAILLFNRRREKSGRPELSVSGIILMSCAVLTKGPVGMVLPCLVLGIYFLMRGDGFLRSFCILCFSGIVSLAGYALWFWFALKQGGDRFFDLMWEENIGRMTGTMSYESHVNPFYYNFITIIAGMVPYTLAALGGLFIARWRGLNLRGLWGKIRGLEPVSLLSLVTVVVTLVFYSIPASKRSVYLLPLYPFLSYFMALLLMRISAVSKRIIILYSGFLAVIALLVAALTVIINAGPVDAIEEAVGAKNVVFVRALHSMTISFAGWICILAACAVALYTFLNISRGNGRRIMWWGIATTFGIYWMLSSTILPAILSSKSDIRIARVIEQYASPDETIYQYITGEMMRFYTTGFYLNDRIVPLQGRSPRMGYVMVNNGSLNEFLKEYGEKYNLSKVYESGRKSCDTRDDVIVFYFTSDFR